MLAFSFLESLELLINTNKTFNELCIRGIKANIENIKKSVNNSLATLTAFVPELGYNRISEIAKNFSNSTLTIKEYMIKNNYITEEKFNELTSSEAVLALGHGEINRRME